MNNIAVIDYDAGNIRSVLNALKNLGQSAILTGDRSEILSAERVILPGVGSFGDAMSKLENYGLIDVIHDVCDSGTPLLGICLGQQLLFDSSEESPGVKGLGIIKGTCTRIPDGTNEEGTVRKIPQIGWNDLSYPETESNCEGRLFKGVPEHSFVYFVHSYCVVPKDQSVIKATTQYGMTIAASVEQGNVFACQFHPEKSSDTGRKILENFLTIPKSSVKEAGR